MMKLYYITVPRRKFWKLIMFIFRSIPSLLLTPQNFNNFLEANQPCQRNLYNTFLEFHETRCGLIYGRVLQGEFGSGQTVMTVYAILGIHDSSRAYIGILHLLFTVQQVHTYTLHILMESMYLYIRIYRTQFQDAKLRMRNEDWEM